MQVCCYLSSLPTELSALQQLEMLDFSHNPTLVYNRGAALAAANLPQLRSCKQLDLQQTRNHRRDTLK